MESKVINALRCNLGAKNEKSGVVVTFPPIHILIEKFSNIYGATCIEHSQYHEDEKEEMAVNNLIFIMYQYFFTIIQKHGSEAIWEQLSRHENEHLWAKLRSFQAEAFRNDMEYIKASFDKDEQKMQKYASQINKRQALIEEKMKNQKKQIEDTRITRLIALFKEELQGKDSEIEELKEKLKVKEWQENIPKLKYVESSYLAGTKGAA